MAFVSEVLINVTKPAKSRMRGEAKRIKKENREKQNYLFMHGIIVNVQNSKESVVTILEYVAIPNVGENGD